MMASIAAINGLGGHAHNPRGNLWFNDDSTYGHKLLMKMGWNKGKGLGKNEDGIKENVKVKFRNTNSGLGFKDDAYANVMKTEYESILKNLAAEYSCPDTRNIIKNDDNTNEEPVHKSKVVKSKLRYPKLFFGKDVTKYSEKDMKSIFICSTPLKNIEGESEKPISTDKKDLETEPMETSVTYSSSLSVSDYFAKKMEAKRNNTLNKNSSDTIIQQQPSLESKNDESSTLTINENSTDKKKQKDSQSDIERNSDDIKELNEVATGIEGVGTENLVLSNKKLSRKRKKKSEDSTKDTEVNSNEIEPCVLNIKKEEAVENSLCKNISLNSNKCVVENVIDQNSSRPKKKRKISQAVENDSVQSSKNELPTEIETPLSYTIKKKKKKKKYSAATQLSSENSLYENNKTEIHEETNDQCLLEPYEHVLSNKKDSSKKKKKSKKKLKEKLKSCLKNKRGSYSLKSVSFNETVSYRIIDSEVTSVDSLTCNENLDKNTLPDKLTDSDQNSSSGDAYSEENIASWEINSDDTVSAKKQDKVSDESDEEYKASDLPSSKSSHYNAWVESQRQALKMQLYKYMLKSIKNHKILKNTNLLSIKGYGNWGYSK